LYINKQRNKYVTDEYVTLAEQFLKLFPEGSFCGDDMLVNNCNKSFLMDAKFMAVFKEVALAPMYEQMAWRLHILDFFLLHSLKKSGSYVECGVFRGFKSYFLIKKNYNKLKNRGKFLFDTFTGIDVDQSDGSPILKYEHEKNGLHDFVIDRFSDFEKLNIIKGSIPGTLNEINIEKVAFLHLDMNSWQAEIAALEHFLPIMTSGGVIVLDDFGLKSHSAQCKEEYPFLKERGIDILELPTGQGVVLL
jgi:O-methyltransferase